MDVEDGGTTCICRAINFCGLQAQRESLPPTFVQAQIWPSKSIRAVVPNAAGTGVDIILRLVLSELSAQLGQPVIIDNRPGAGGTIGAAAVAKAEPDGYTILAQNNSAHTVVPYMHAHLTYDPARDLLPVVPLGAMPLVLCCAPSKGLNSIHDLVTAAKAKPGSLTYASGGIGTNSHLSAARLELSAGFRAVHVPFRGVFTAEVLSGQIDYAYSPIGNVIDLIREGRLVALAVSGRSRAALLPNIPTTLEAGYVNSEVSFYVGMFVPAKTPREIVEGLNHDTGIILRTSEIRDKLTKIGAESMVMTATEFDAFIKEEFLANGVLVQSLGLAPI
jgi:tripartite-type tricarboxylate transporter receptor subunit TctC